MKEIVVTSQTELDSLPLDFDGRIIIKFGTHYNRAVVNRRFKYRVEARGNSSVVAWGNSSVVAWGNSSVEAWGNSSVVAWGNSSVVAWENSSVVAWGNSSVEARGNSSVVAWGNSSVEARENSSVVARENSSVVASGNTQVVDSTRSHDIEISGNARIVYNPQNAAEYLRHHGIEQAGGKAKLYKAVHKRDGRYFSDHDNSFEYTIGKEAAADRLDTDTGHDCGSGIHIAHKAWVLDYGRDWKDLAIIEVEADISKIVVPKDCTGKVRTDKVLVIREVPLEECGLLGRILAKNRK